MQRVRVRGMQGIDQEERAAFPEAGLMSRRSGDRLASRGVLPLFAGICRIRSRAGRGSGGIRYGVAWALSPALWGCCATHPGRLGRQRRRKLRAEESRLGGVAPAFRGRPAAS